MTSITNTPFSKEYLTEILGEDFVNMLPPAFISNQWRIGDLEELMRTPWGFGAMNHIRPEQVTLSVNSAMLVERFSDIPAFSIGTHQGRKFGQVTLYATPVVVDMVTIPAHRSGGYKALWATQIAINTEMRLAKEGITVVDRKKLVADTYRLITNLITIKEPIRFNLGLNAGRITGGYPHNNLRFKKFLTEGSASAVDQSGALKGILFVNSVTSPFVIEHTDNLDLSMFLKDIRQITSSFLADLRPLFAQFDIGYGVDFGDELWFGEGTPPFIVKYLLSKQM